MREISLDTETTGLESARGDRIVEIGCVELENHVATGRVFHVYLNPDRAMSPEAAEITGLKDDFLATQPSFEDVADEFAAFIADATLVIHNAAFDVGFINMEFARVGRPAINPDRVVDTLAMAHKRFPGAQASLDALCRRFQIDLSSREKHGALLDAELLALVYLELRGGRQPTFALGASTGVGSVADAAAFERVAWTRRLRARLTEKEAAAHKAFIDELGEGSVWRALEPSAAEANVKA